MSEVVNDGVLDEIMSGMEEDAKDITSAARDYEEDNSDVVVSDSAEDLLPPLEGDREVLVSTLLGVSSEELPARDFGMPVFDESSCPEQLAPYLVDVDRENLCSYQPDIKAGYRVCLGLRYNLPQLLTGVKGVGKTSLVYWIGSNLRWPVVNIVGHAQLGTDELFGQVRLISDEDKNSVTVFDKGLFTLGVEYGAVVLFDEVFQTPSTVLSSCNSVLEKGGNLPLPSLYGDNKVIDKHRHCRFVFTSNSRGGGDLSGKYVGEEVINSATLDRIQMVTEVTQMPPTRKKAVLKNRLKRDDGTCRVSQKELTQFVSIAEGINEAFGCGQLNDTMSMRGLISFAELAVITGDKALAFKMTVMDKVDDPQERSVLEGIAKTRGGDEMMRQFSQ